MNFVLAARAQSGDMVRDSYGNEDLPSLEAGLVLSWTMGGVTGDEYHVARRVVEPAGPVQEWQILEEGLANNTYTDLDGAFGFEYDYQITLDRKVGPSVTVEEEGLVMYSRDPVFALGHGANAVKLYIPRISLGEHEAYRVRRYVSPASDAPFAPVLTDDGITLANEITDPGLVDAQVYRYEITVMEPREPGSELLVATDRQSDVFVRAGSPSLTAPTSFVAAGPPTSDDNPFQGTPTPPNENEEDPEFYQLRWNLPADIHRSEYAFFEILRKDAKDRGANFKVVGATNELRDNDYTVRFGEYYEYAVRPVDWDHTHGPLFSADPFPVIPQPKCVNLDGNDGQVTEAHLRPTEFAPWNRWFAVQARLMNVDPGSVDPWCYDFELSDWYVERQTREFYSVSFPLCESDDSCNALWVEDTLDDVGFQYLGGQFLQDGPSRIAGDPGAWVWYDDAFSVAPGLYRHEYQMCSYATSPQICSVLQEGPWRFENVDDIPVVDYIP